jgi:hypothetical protein
MRTLSRPPLGALSEEVSPRKERLGLAGVVISDNGVGDNVGSGLSWASDGALEQ